MKPETKKQTKDFDPPYHKAGDDVIVDKSGAKHDAHSRVRHLARMALKKQLAKTNEGLEEADQIVVSEEDLDNMVEDFIAESSDTDSLNKTVKVDHDGALNPTKHHMSYVDSLVKSGEYKYFSTHSSPGYPASILKHVASGKKVNISTGDRDHKTFSHVHRVLESVSDQTMLDDLAEFIVNLDNSDGVELSEMDFGSMAKTLSKYGGSKPIVDTPKKKVSRSATHPEFTATGHIEKKSDKGTVYTKVLPDYDDADDVKTASKTTVAPEGEVKRGRGRPKGSTAKAGFYKPRDPAGKAASAAKAAATKAANKAAKAKLTEEDCEDILEGLGFNDIVEMMMEDAYKNLDEVSGKFLGNYIQKARKDIESRVAKGKALDADDKVKALSDKWRDYFNRREYTASGDSKYRKQLDSTSKKIEDRKKALDPDYPNSTLTSKRRMGVDTAIKKLQYGKLSEGAIKDAETALANHAQRKIDREKEEGPLSAPDLFRHNQIHKQLLAKKRRAQSAYHKKMDSVTEAESQVCWGRYDDMEEETNESSSIAFDSKDEWTQRHQEFTDAGRNATHQSIKKTLDDLAEFSKKSFGKRGVLNSIFGKKSNGDLDRASHAADTLHQNISKNANAKHGTDARKELGQHLIYARSLMGSKNESVEQTNESVDPSVAYYASKLNTNLIKE